MSAFRDAAEKFAGKHAQVLGVSKDDLHTPKRYAQSQNRNFPLLADPMGEASEAYGVKNATYASRATFVIGPDGQVVKVVEGKDALDPTGALDACPIHKKKT